MSRPLLTPPMPVFLSTTDDRDVPPTIQCLQQAADLYGEGSQAFRVAQRAFPKEVIRHCYPPLTPQQVAAEAEYRRNIERGAIEAAFAIVGQCLALVEAHAIALFDADETASGGCAMAWFRHCRALAFRSLALLYQRSPELLPIGDAVHADCRGDDL